MNFSTDWAPGSSGSAVVDQCGNVLGHVSQISGLSKDRNTSAFVTLHTGIPALGVLMLAQACQNPEDIAQLCALEAKEIPAKEKEEAVKPAAEAKPSKK